MVESAETILFYKFPQFSRKELERMFNLVDIEETAVYREALSEGERKGEKKGRLEAVPLLLEAGVSVERVAEALNPDVDEVRRATELASPAKGARPRRQASRSPKNGSPAA
jgi:predicted transposase YdaD